MRKYPFVLENSYLKYRILGHAYTLAGISHIFRKVTNADKCEVYKKHDILSNKPFIIYQK